MKSTLNSVFDKLNASFWLIPSLMAVFSLLLLGVTGMIDFRMTGENSHMPWLVSSSTEGARQLLSSLVTALITVVGIVFSVTLVSLTVASTQYGPHVLRTYMKDRFDQITLGVFISTFLYALITLRMIRGSGEEAFIPHISITVCLVMALCSVGFLIYFIHHMVDCIHVEKIIRRLGKQLESSATHFFREGDADRDEITLKREQPEHFDYVIRTRYTGFVETIDKKGLFKEAEKRNVVIVLKVRPGDFVFKEQALAGIVGKEQISQKCRDKIEQGFSIGSNRTPYQDILFNVEQIVEIALKALSPSMNEPFVANLCIDYLGAGLLPLLKRPAPSGYHYSKGRLCLIEKTVECAAVINDCFHQIRQNSARHPAVSGHLLGTIAKLAPYTSNDEQCRTLRRHADLIREGCLKELPIQVDCAYVEEDYFKAVEALENAKAAKYPEAA